MTRLEAYGEVLACLENVERNNSSVPSARAMCPLCESTLTVRLGTHSPVVYCHGDGCHQRDVFNSLGLTEMIDGLPHIKADLREHLRILAEKGASEAEKVTFIAYWTFANDDGLCWPSDLTVAELIGKARGSVYRLRQQLCDKGIMEREIHGKGRTNLYRLVNPADVARDSGEPNPPDVAGSTEPGEATPADWIERQDEPAGLTNPATVTAEPRDRDCETPRRGSTNPAPVAAIRDCKKRLREGSEGTLAPALEMSADAEVTMDKSPSMTKVRALLPPTRRSAGRGQTQEPL